MMTPDQDFGPILRLEEYRERKIRHAKNRRRALIREYEGDMSEEKSGYVWGAVFWAAALLLLLLFVSLKSHACYLPKLDTTINQIKVKAL